MQVQWTWQSEGDQDVSNGRLDVQLVDLPQKHAQDRDWFSRWTRIVGCRRQTKVRNVPKVEYRRSGRPNNCRPVRFTSINILFCHIVVNCLLAVYGDYNVGHITAVQRE